MEFKSSTFHRRASSREGRTTIGSQRAEKGTEAMKISKFESEIIKSGDSDDGLILVLLEIHEDGVKVVNNVLYSHNRKYLEKTSKKWNAGKLA